jgi:hypothetical protein
LNRYQVVLVHNPLMPSSVSLYHRQRFPAEIISHSVGLYFASPSASMMLTAAAPDGVSVYKNSHSSILSINSAEQ